jgi:hypothetical protein
MMTEYGNIASYEVVIYLVFKNINLVINSE